ncbi:MAG: dynamin family protein [Verrucomicrobia bacterium]|nr:dynamin family protein [Verrucomicrobiota bacterium]
MFGERYFATRERLSEVMVGIAALAADTGRNLAGQLPLAELETGLGPPFLFVVCGEVNAGKSTLLNALCGHELCKVSRLPETKQVLWYRYGASARDVPSTPMLEERYRPLDFLRDCNLVDTPGTNSGMAGLPAIIEQILPAAELIFCVFPVSNPWAAATWNFISRLPPEALGRVLIIIQQIDQRDPADLKVILGHLRDLSLRRIGQVLPMFAVSGKLACEAKYAAPGGARQLAASAYPALEEYISRRISSTPSRKMMLDGWRGQAAAALRSVEDQIEIQTRDLHFQGTLLEEIEREIDGMREQFLIRLPQHLSGVAEVFQTEAVGVASLLGKRLGVARSVVRLFVGDRTSQEIEAVFIERLQTTVEAVAETDGSEVVAACRQHWSHLGTRVRQVMGVDLGNAVDLDATLDTARRCFVQRLGRAARQGIGNLKVRNQLGKDLLRRNVALKSFTFMTLLLLTAGATCGALSLPWAPLVLCGLSLLFCGLGVLIGWLTRKSLSAEFQERLLDTCGAYASTLSADYEQALRIVFQDYADSLAAIRRHLAGERQAIEPIQRRWSELFLTLKAIEQDL